MSNTKDIFITHNWGTDKVAKIKSVFDLILFKTYS